MANRWGNSGNSGRLFLGAPKSLQMVTEVMKFKGAYSLKEVMTNLNSILKSRDIILPTKVCLVKAMVFPVVMYGCESWTIKKVECGRIDAFELWCWRRLSRVPWTYKEIQPVHSKGDWSWVFIGRTDVELKLQYFGYLMWRADSFEKTLMLEKDWGLEEKGTTEDETIEWHHRLNGHEFEQTPWVGDGQGGLASCGSWGRKESQRVRQDWVTELTDSRPIFVKKKGVMVLNDIFDCKLLEFVTSSKFQAILT